AQRPFPSMMIATWRGSVSGPSGTFFAIISSLDSGPRASDLHDLVLLILERVVNVVDMGVRHLLQFLAQPAVIILADLMVLFALFQELHAVPADVTYGNPALLGIFMRKLDQFLAPLLIQFWDGYAQQLSVNLRIETKTSIPDGLVHSLDQALIPDLYRQEPGLRCADRPQLAYRHRVSVGLDLHRVEQRRARAARAQPGQLRLEACGCAVHPAVQLILIVGIHEHSSRREHSSPVPR